MFYATNHCGGKCAFVSRRGTVKNGASLRKSSIGFREERRLTAPYQATFTGYHGVAFRQKFLGSSRERPRNVTVTLGPACALVEPSRTRAPSTFSPAVRLAGVITPLTRTETTECSLGAAIPPERQAGAAGAPVFGNSGTHRVGAVAAYEPSVPVGDHRAELDARHAIWASNGQGCVGWHWALPHESERGTQDSVPQSANPLENKGPQHSHTEIEANPAPSFRQACPKAG